MNYYLSGNIFMLIRLMLRAVTGFYYCSRTTYLLSVFIILV